MGGTAWHSCRCRTGHSICVVTMPRIRGASWRRRSELGLEPGRQSFAAQRRRSGQLPAAEQRTQIPSGRTDTSHSGLRRQYAVVRKEL